KPFGAIAASLRVHRDELTGSYCFSYSRGHFSDDGQIVFISGIPVSSKYPDDCFSLIPFSEIPTVGIGVFWCENFRAYSPGLIELITPGGQQSDKHAQFICFVDDIVDMPEIGLIGLFRVIVMKGFFP